MITQALERLPLGHITVVYYTRWRNFLLYCIIGATGATLDYLLFVLLFNVLHWPAAGANFLSMTLGISNNFIWNALFNFKKTNRLWLRFVSFYVIGLVGILISSGIIIVFHDLLQFNGNMVKIASIVVIAIIQFFLNNKISFASHEPKK